MHTVGHDPNAFHAPLGFVDTLTLLTLAAAVLTTCVVLVTAIGLLL
jgi:hypothetical protein